MSTIEKAMGELRHTSPKSNAAEALKSSADALSGAESQPAVTKIEGKKEPFKDSSRIIPINNSLLESLGMINNGSNESERQIKDEFRLIKHKLLKKAFTPEEEHKPSANKRNLIMVSSPNMNEGKTFVSINLALSIASEQDKTVLLIDADVLSPSIGDTLGFDNDMPGLTDYLLGNVGDLSDIIYPTTVPDFRVMPAGSSNNMSYELLSSGKMAALMEEIASRYSDRIILLDCPPLLGVVETVTLSNLVGQAIVVVEQNKTKLGDIKQAVALLNSEIDTGFVINKAVQTAGHGYGYGYGYGYGSKDNKK
ncbi:AAA family ATPase [Vibrio tritonius]|uniref:AAA family ATPase n=1 Tax=Vibrio tritonius TaxID=1435069 RepID=UPI000838F3B8|nr:AAA family ATPase [Vibrio tritonius]